MSEQQPQQPFSNFQVHPSTSSFTISSNDYVSKRPELKAGNFLLATGAAVFSGSKPDRILLIQRAAGDSMPNRWEIPGGACDDDDPTILHGVARELWEESGLTAVRIGPRFGGDDIFRSRSGKVICKLYFFVDIDNGDEDKVEVKLDPKEHQNLVWATEEEVKAKKVGDLELTFTTATLEKNVLESFQIRKELRAEEI